MQRTAREYTEKIEWGNRRFLDYLQESINPDIVKAVRELQEQVAKDKGEPIRFLFTRVI